MSKFIARHFDSFNLGRVLVILLLSLVFTYPGWAGAKKYDLTNPGPEIMAKHPRFTRAQNTSYKFDSFLNDYLLAISENWLKVAPDRNPAMLQMFADRDVKPTRNLLCWSGEFAGKYLTAAVQVLRLTKDKELRDYLANFVTKLVGLQADNGYLGPWPQGYHLTGKGPNVFGKKIGNTWDTWNHYHIMMGLLLWYEDTDDLKALNAAKKIGDLMCDKFLGKPGSFAGTGSCEMNLAPIHSLCLLYKQTQNQRYLNLARQILTDEFPDSKAGDYVRTALAGKEFYQTPKPRWESLHPIMGIVELYWITGDENYRKAFEHIWWSIVKLDRHNTGGFSSGEQAYGNPYHLAPIETCCTIAWTAMSVEMLKLTGNPIVADELELTFINAVLGSYSPTGKWSTYNTPMNGTRIPNTISIAFQKRPGSEELNCCSVNAPRGFGMISDWALMTDNKGLILNWYGPSTMSTEVKGVPVTLKQQTDYPRTGYILLKVLPSEATEFTLKLRIPYWSKKTNVTINDILIKDVARGMYFSMNRKWKKGDTIKIELDMSLHYWAGERQCEGKTSIYRGPVLLTYTPTNIRENITTSWGWHLENLTYRHNRKGATITYTFEGDSIRWVGTSSDNAGKALVKIDGKEVATVDQYGQGRKLPFVWEHKGLGPGKHKFQVTVLPDKNEKSKGNWINVNVARFPEREIIPTLDATNTQARLIETQKAPGAIVLMEFSDIHGNKFYLSDFDSAGRDGKHYITWLNVLNAPKIPFSRNNPLRSGRVGM